MFSVDSALLFCGFNFYWNDHSEEIYLTCFFVNEANTDENADLCGTSKVKIISYLLEMPRVNVQISTIPNPPPPPSPNAIWLACAAKIVHREMFNETDTRSEQFLKLPKNINATDFASASRHNSWRAPHLMPVAWGVKSSCINISSASEIQQREVRP